MIAITNRQRARKVDARRLKQIAEAALAALGLHQAEVNVVLVGAREMAAINEKFLNHEGPTDVITFDYSDKGAERHGEIFVCVAVAQTQAKEFGTDWRSEVVRYVVHGLLHLLGHDDLETAARKKMKRAEGRLVRELSRRFALSKL